MLLLLLWLLYAGGVNASGDGEGKKGDCVAEDGVVDSGVVWADE